MHLAATGLACELPVSQAVTVRTEGRVRVVRHLLGGMPSDHSEPRPFFHTSGEICLVREPPLPGRTLPFAGVESDAVEALLSPVASLGGNRATRSWVQRVVTALAGVPTTEMLHFTGHGTLRALPAAIRPQSSCSPTPSCWHRATSQWSRQASGSWCVRRVT